MFRTFWDTIYIQERTRALLVSLSFSVETKVFGRNEVFVNNSKYSLMDHLSSSVSKLLHFCTVTIPSTKRFNDLFAFQEI